MKVIYKRSDYFEAGQEAGEVMAEVVGNEKGKEKKAEQKADLIKGECVYHHTQPQGKPKTTLREIKPLL